MARHPIIRRALWLTLLFVVVFLSVLGGWVWSLWHEEPAYYQPIVFETPEAASEAERRADRLEQATTSRVTAVRPVDETWTYKLTQQQANEWLATRLDDWAVSQGILLSDYVTDPMVLFQPGRLVLATRVTLPDFDHVVTVVYEPAPPPAGSFATQDQATDAAPPAAGPPVAMLALTKVVAGRLPLPRDFLMDRIFNSADVSEAEAEQIRGLIEQVPLRIDLGDGRIVEVAGVQLDDQVLTLICRTVAADRGTTTASLAAD